MLHEGSLLAKYDYLFVDESGDPGFAIDSDSGTLKSSRHYVAAVLHICDNAIPRVSQRVADFRFYTGLNRDLKLPPEQEKFDKLLGPIGALAESSNGIWGTVVYLDKCEYTGRYLKPGGTRPADPVLFRNHILRCLLEHHFRDVCLQSSHYDLVLDRVEMTKAQAENLQRYLAGNYNIPTPTEITHAASAYVEPLQIAHHLASGFKNVVSGERPPAVLGFVRAYDITVCQFVS